jgi:hypothetical protein
MQAIAQTLGLLDETALNRAVTALSSARRIEIYGVGSSAPIAVDAYYRLPPDGVLMIQQALVRVPKVPLDRASSRRSRGRAGGRSYWGITCSRCCARSGRSKRGTATSLERHIKIAA